MSGAELMAVGSFFVMLLGAIAGVWWRIEAKVERAKSEASLLASAANALASLTRQELAEHRLHVAETYSTKAGIRETKEEIMDAIHGVKAAVDHMAGRVDRVVENQTKPTRAARG
jgi:archaellum component FlaC